MATQEPINTQDFMASFKGFMDKAVAQAPDEEPVFLRSLHAHFGKEPKDLPTVKSEPYEIYTGLAVEFEDPFGNRLGITGYSKQANRVRRPPPTAPRLTARVNPTIYAPPPHSTRNAQHRTVYSRVDPCGQPWGGG